jgi:hypothetical protein
MTETTGTDVLRATVKARNKTPHALSLLADEIKGVGVGALEAFFVGKIDLSVEAKKQLAEVLYQNAEFNAEADRLQPGPPRSV